MAGVVGMIELKLRLPNEPFSDDLDLIYVGESVLVCLVITDDQLCALEDKSIIVSLEGFHVTDARRLFSNSTVNVNRMRSVESLLSDLNSSHLDGVSVDDPNGSFWKRTRLSESTLVYSLIFTPQPMSDDACNVNCKFSVSLKVVETVKCDVRFDDYIEGYLDSLGEYNNSRSERTKSIIKNIGVFEKHVVLSNPLRVTRHLKPMTASECIVDLDLESLDEDLYIDACLMKITNECNQTSFECFTGDGGKLPLTVGAFGEHLQFSVFKGEQYTESMFRMKISVSCLHNKNNRRSCLTFSSPFDMSMAFLEDKKSEELSVSFVCKEDSVPLGATFPVTIRIVNNTDNGHALRFTFPLVDPSLRPDPFSLYINKNQRHMLKDVVKERLELVPAFVCTINELDIGMVRGRSVYEATIHWMATKPGTHSLPLILLQKNGVDQFIFTNVLTLRVE